MAKAAAKTAKLETLLAVAESQDARPTLQDDDSQGDQLGRDLLEGLYALRDGMGWMNDRISLLTLSFATGLNSE
jgi:hypothetical protein